MLATVLSGYSNIAIIDMYLECGILKIKTKAGPIPGDCDYSELRTAFLSHGQTCHLFIQNNQVILSTVQFVFLNQYIQDLQNINFHSLLSNSSSGC